MSLSLYTDHSLHAQICAPLAGPHPTNVITLVQGLSWNHPWISMRLVQRLTHEHTQQAGFPGRPRGKEAVCDYRSLWRQRFDPWVRKILWRRKWQPPPVFLPGKSHRQRNLEGYSPWSHKESDTTEHARKQTQQTRVYQKSSSVGTSLVVQGLIIHLAMQGSRFNPWLGNLEPTCAGAARPLCHNYWVCTLQSLHATTREFVRQNKRPHMRQLKPNVVK